jgi:hypothetical protein
MMRAKQIKAYDVNAVKNSMYFKGEHDIFTTLDGCVTHFCHTTPTECPRTTTDTPVSRPVAVHIDFHGYLQYFCISSV